MNELAEMIYDRNQSVIASFFEDERYGEDEFLDELVDDIVSAIQIAEGEEFAPEVEDLIREQVMNGLT